MNKISLRIAELHLTLVWRHHAINNEIITGIYYVELKYYRKGAITSWGRIVPLLKGECNLLWRWYCDTSERFCSDMIGIFNWRVPLSRPTSVTPFTAILTTFLLSNFHVFCDATQVVHADPVHLRLLVSYPPPPTIVNSILFAGNFRGNRRIPCAKIRARICWAMNWPRLVIMKQ